MNRNFVFFGNFGFTVFGYRWFTSRSQFDFQKFYKKLKISFFQKPQFHAGAQHHQNISPPSTPPPLNFHGQNSDGARELKAEMICDE